MSSSYILSRPCKDLVLFWWNYKWNTCRIEIRDPTTSLWCYTRVSSNIELWPWALSAWMYTLGSISLDVHAGFYQPGCTRRALSAWMYTPGSISLDVHPGLNYQPGCTRRALSAWMYTLGCLPSVGLLGVVSVWFTMYRAMTTMIIAYVAVNNIAIA